MTSTSSVVNAGDGEGELIAGWGMEVKEGCLASGSRRPLSEGDALFRCDCRIDKEQVGCGVRPGTPGSRRTSCGGSSPAGCGTSDGRGRRGRAVRDGPSPGTSGREPTRHTSGSRGNRRGACSVGSGRRLSCHRSWRRGEASSRMGRPDGRTVTPHGQGPSRQARRPPCPPGGEPCEDGGVPRRATRPRSRSRHEGSAAHRTRPRRCPATWLLSFFCWIAGTAPSGSRRDTQRGARKKGGPRSQAVSRSGLSSTLSACGSACRVPPFHPMAQVNDSSKAIPCQAEGA